jgi:hypothetical protein
MQALSTMHCGCGVRHRRYPVASRTQQLARYCQKCREYHSAKDVSFLFINNVIIYVFSLYIFIVIIIIISLYTG